MASRSTAPRNAPQGPASQGTSTKRQMAAPKPSKPMIQIEERTLLLGAAQIKVSKNGSGAFITIDGSQFRLQLEAKRFLDDPDVQGYKNKELPVKMHVGQAAGLPRGCAGIILLPPKGHPSLREAKPAAALASSASGQVNTTKLVVQAPVQASPPVKASLPEPYREVVKVEIRSRLLMPHGNAGALRMFISTKNDQEGKARPHLLKSESGSRLTRQQLQAYFNQNVRMECHQIPRRDVQDNVTWDCHATVRLPLAFGVIADSATHTVKRMSSMPNFGTPASAAGIDARAGLRAQLMGHHPAKLSYSPIQRTSQSSSRASSQASTPYRTQGMPTPKPRPGALSNAQVDAKSLAQRLRSLTAA